jgi:hypothetical protein
MLNNTRPLRFTAAAGTKLAGASPTSNVIILLVVLSFTTYDRSSLNGHYWIKLSLIVQDSSLLPPVGVWPFSVPVWLCDLLAQLGIIGLVGPYPANYLNPNQPIQ